MSHTRNTHKLSDKSRTDIHASEKHEDDGEVMSGSASEARTYAVTVSKKPSGGAEEAALCGGQKSFISIHSTDQLCQVDAAAPAVPDECSVEVLSLNEVFPSTSEESLSDDESPCTKKQKNQNLKKPKYPESKPPYLPCNSKSSVLTGRSYAEPQPSVYSDFDIPKSTMYVLGSNPGEPKMSYADPPKKLTKTMKKLLRNMDKHRERERPLSKLTTVRGILKDGRCGPECTGDSTNTTAEDDTPDVSLAFPMDFSAHSYAKPGADKNVTFNTQVVIIHFTGDLCVGQSVETLSKEKDQQARNSELRKTFLTKYNEFWPSQK